MTSITWQDGSVRRYHHEDARWPNAVTGITNETGVHCGSYANERPGPRHEERARRQLGMFAAGR